MRVYLLYIFLCTTNGQSGTRDCRWVGDSGVFASFQSCDSRGKFLQGQPVWDDPITPNLQVSYAAHKCEKREVIQ